MGVFRKTDFMILGALLVLIWVIFAAIMGNDFRPEQAIPQTLVVLVVFAGIWITRFFKGR